MCLVNVNAMLQWEAFNYQMVYDYYDIIVNMRKIKDETIITIIKSKLLRTARIDIFEWNPNLWNFAITKWPIHFSTVLKLLENSMNIYSYYVIYI